MVPILPMTRSEHLVSGVIIIAAVRQPCPGRAEAPPGDAAVTPELDRHLAPGADHLLGGARAALLHQLGLVRVQN